MMGARVGGVTALFIVVFFFSCNTSEMDGNSDSKKNRMLIGTWEQQVELDSTIVWEFTANDLKWKSFSNAYVLRGDTMVVSGMDYLIKEQNLDSLVLLSPVNETIRLRRTFE